MGDVDAKKRQRRRPHHPSAYPYGEETAPDTLKVDGTSRFQPQLAELVGVMDPEGVHLEVPGALMPEWQGGRRVAVAVHLLDSAQKWWRVGEPSPVIATAYWPVLQWLQSYDRYGICVAHIKGGFLKESGGVGLLRCRCGSGSTRPALYG